MVRSLTGIAGYLFLLRFHSKSNRIAELTNLGDEWTDNLLANKDFEKR